MVPPGLERDGACQIRVIAVHANIASGKTTMLDLAEARGFRVFRENISKMMPFLNSMYKDKGRSSDMLQMCVGVEQLRVMRAIKAIDPAELKPDADGNPVVLVERWVGDSEHVFIKAASEQDHISISGEAINMWRDLVRLSGLCDFPVAHHVYIRTDPVEAHTRIVERSHTRTSEVRNIARGDMLADVHGAGFFPIGLGDLRLGLCDPNE